MDVFFDRYEIEHWQELPAREDAEPSVAVDEITVAWADRTCTLSADRALPQEETAIFTDLRRYMQYYYAGQIAPATISAHSFDGGGPSYRIEMGTKGIFTWFSQRHYLNANHEQLCGAGYDVSFAFYPLRPGKASALLFGDSPICPTNPKRILVEVDEQLQLHMQTEEINLEAYQDKLNGFWEERGVIGTRLEIDAPHLTVLWRNDPVLETAFQIAPKGDGVVLLPEHTGLRYSRANEDYAELKELYFHDDCLELVKYFPITGESSETLHRTENSRYGNYDLADEILDELQGTWEDAHQLFRLRFTDDVLEMDDEQTCVVALRSKNAHTSQQRYKIADADPAVFSVIHLYSLDYIDGVLYGQNMICDAPPMQIEFHKTDTT